MVWLLSAGKSIKDELNQFLGLGRGGLGWRGVSHLPIKMGLVRGVFVKGEKRIMFCWFVVLVLFLFCFVLFCLIG